MFRRALRDVALYGRMSYRDKCLLIKWADHRGWVMTEEMWSVLGWLRHEEELCWENNGVLTEILCEQIEGFGFRSLALELKWFLRDAARTPPDTRCCESSSEPTNEFCESFHHSLVASW